MGLQATSQSNRNKNDFVHTPISMKYLPSKHNYHFKFCKAFFYDCRACLPVLRACLSIITHSENDNTWHGRVITSESEQRETAHQQKNRMIKFFSHFYIKLDIFTLLQIGTLPLPFFCRKISIAFICFHNKSSHWQESHL